jgi:hypothetical protein
MTSGRTGVRAQVWVAATTAVLAALLIVACGGGSGHPAAAPATGTTATGTTVTGTTATGTTATTLPDVAPTPADFVNINTMTRVGDHFVGSLNGHLAAALTIAHSAQGGVYPVGTVIQLIPTEAMVKRRKGYSPATRDWEFFSLRASPQGTTIVQSGAKVKNFLGLDCASCHRAAQPRFDFVCGKTHGCAPLGVSDQLIAGLQSGDPRPKH